MRLAIWFGLISGWLEVIARVLRKEYGGRLLAGGWHLVWMPSVSNAALFIVLGSLVGLILTRLSSDRTVAVAAGLFAALGSYDVLLVFLRPLARWSILIVALGIGIQVWRLMRGPKSMATGFGRLVDRTVWFMAAGAGAAAVLVTVASGGSTARANGSGSLGESAPNVLLLVLDTARSLNMSAHGYSRATTPALEALATRGVRFDFALSPSPWTLPGHASMFTGKWPAELGADWRRAMNDTTPNLAEVLSAAGYRTGGFVANLSYTSREMGLARGFDRFDAFRVTPRQILMSSRLGNRLANLPAVRGWLPGPPHALWDRKTAAEVNRTLLDWIDRDSSPFFAFANYFDVHQKYYWPADLDSLFPDGSGPSTPRQTPGGRGGDRSQTVDKYDRAMRFLDRQLGDLFAELERRDLLRNTIVIVTSDHGEEFSEHGLLGHGHSLYLPSLRIPLILAGPGVPRGAVIDQPVSVRDLAQTVLDLTNTAGPDRLDGVSLARYWRAPAGQVTDTLYASVRYAANLPAWYPISKGDMFSLLADGMHGILGGDGSFELFDIQADPWEQSDLAADPRHRTRVAEWTRWLSRRDPGRFDTEQRR